MAADAGADPDLNQDSDEENERVRKRTWGSKKEDEIEYNPPVLFFEKPFRRPNDVRFQFDTFKIKS